MRIVAMLVLGAALMSAAEARSWKTVTLDEGVTIDIPGAAGDEYLPTKKARAQGQLMFFSLASDEDTLACGLHRNAYGKKLSHDQAVLALAGPKREVFCSGGTMRASQAAANNGYPAGYCVASASVAGQKGRMDAALAIAAPEALYLLSCTVSAASQEDAEERWKSHDSDVFKRMQESLRLSKQ